MENRDANSHIEKKSERRQFVRKPLIVAVFFDGGATTGLATTRDIGLGGLYMATETNLPLNSMLKMRLNFADRELELDGIVTYLDDGQGVGVRFQNLSREIEDFLRGELPAIETAQVKFGKKQE